MKTEVTTTESREVSKEVTICDKCGLEAPDAIPLYRDMETHVHGPHTGSETVEYGSRLIVERNRFGQVVHARKFKFEPGSVVVEELRDDEPDVELCEGCYDEVLSWGED